MSVIFIGDSFYSHQCFTDDSYETVVIAAKTPWGTSLASFFSCMNREKDWIGAVPKDVANFSRISETIIIKLLYRFFNFSSPGYFFFKILCLAFSCLLLFSFIFLLTNKLHLAFFFSLIFSLATPVYLSMGYFIDFSVVTICLTSLCLLLLPLFFEQNKISKLIYALYFFFALFALKMHKSAAIIPLLAIILIFIKYFTDKEILKLLKVKLLFIFSIYSIVSVIPLGLTRFNFPKWHWDNIFLLLFNNRPDNYNYGSNYDPFIGLSLFNILKWLIFLGIFIIVLRIRPFFVHIAKRLFLLISKKVKPGRNGLYLAIIILWIGLEAVFLAVPFYPDPRYLIYILLPTLILIAWGFNFLVCFIVEKKLPLFLFYGVLFLAFFLTLKDNFSKDVEKLFSKDYPNRAFYGTYAIIYSTKHPLKGIEDYQNFSKSLRNYRDFYKNIRYFPREDEHLEHEYVLVNNLSRIPDYQSYYQLGKINLDNEKNFKFLRLFFPKKTDITDASCYVFKRVSCLNPETMKDAA